MKTSTLGMMATLAFGAMWILGQTGAMAAEPTLTLKQNDVWVMAGDSITAQRLHSNYIEAFFRTRYPNLNLQFRNSGIGGNRTNHILARFDYDVAAWKPTIVSIELGMNDVNNGDDPAVYIDGMRKLIKNIRDIKAQPVLISSSPVNDGSLMDNWKSDRCRRIHPYTEALKKLAAEENVVFVDQYHPLIELWGKNKQKAPAPAATTKAAPAKPGEKPRSPREEISDKPTESGYVALGGDAVHPGGVGQYNMAATILAGLKVDGEVSSATLKADGKVVDAKRCKISDVTASAGKVSFTRLDECSPWPIDPKCRTALALLPSTAELSKYMLTVQDLPAGKYVVSINGKPAATLTEKELSAGWNMSTAMDGALGERSAEIVSLIAKLQGKPNSDWRAAGKAKDAAKLAAAQKDIDACEKEIQKACQPVSLKIEISPQGK